MPPGAFFRCAVLGGFNKRESGTNENARRKSKVYISDVPRLHRHLAGGERKRTPLAYRSPGRAWCFGGRWPGPGCRGCRSAAHKAQLAVRRSPQRQRRPHPGVPPRGRAKEDPAAAQRAAAARPAPPSLDFTPRYLVSSLRRRIAGDSLNVCFRWNASHLTASGSDEPLGNLLRRRIVPTHEGAGSQFALT